jgi:bifunctional non-homologous end joining protein LigD
VADLGVIDWNPWAVRRPDGDHPDELRIDLDPTPGPSDWGDVREVTLCAREVLEENGLGGFPKTSGSRGIHVYCHIEQKWDFLEVRRPPHFRKQRGEPARVQPSRARKG